MVRLSRGLGALDDTGQHACSQSDGNSKLPLVSECGLSDVATRVLHLTRHICAGYALRDYDGVQRALEAELLLSSAVDAAQVVSATTSMILAIKDDRTKPFDFINPNCPNCCRHISLAELTVVALIEEIIQGDHNRIANTAQLVVNGGDPHAVICAASNLVVVINNAQSGGRTMHTLNTAKYH
ncbi:MAG: hypothetical protein AAF732_13030 [Pseudomonadota bacterium]